MTDDISPQRAAALRIAAARDARVPVDSQGRPTAPPTTFEYDARGRLIRATPAPVEDE